MWLRPAQRTPSGALRAVLGALVTAVCLPLAASPALAATWTEIPTPNRNSFDNTLWGVDALSPSSAWAVGRAVTGTSPSVQPLIQRWDGGRWRIVTSPLPAGGGELRDVDAISPTAAWAVGHTGTAIGADTLIQRWDGRRWRTVASPNVTAQNYLAAVKAFSATEVWAVGQHSNPGRLGFSTLIQRWDGGQWTVVPSPNPHPSENVLMGVDGASPDDLWAVGRRDGGDYAVPQPLILHWDGSSWTTAGVPPVRSGTLHDVVAVASDDVWAVGSTFSLTLFREVPLALHWDGRAWSTVNVPAPSPEGGRLHGVAALSPGQVYAVGEAWTGGGIRTLAMRWNGAEWTVESTPSPAATAHLWDAAATAPGGVWAVGERAELRNSSLASSRTLALRSTDG